MPSWLIHHQGHRPLEIHEPFTNTNNSYKLFGFNLNWYFIQIHQPGWLNSSLKTSLNDCKICTCFVLLFLWILFKLDMYMYYPFTCSSKDSQNWDMKYFFTCQRSDHAPIQSIHSIAIWAANWMNSSMAQCLHKYQRVKWHSEWCASKWCTRWDLSARYLGLLSNKRGQSEWSTIKSLQNTIALPSVHQPLLSIGYKSPMIAKYNA